MRLSIAEIIPSWAVISAAAAMMTLGCNVGPEEGGANIDPAEVMSAEHAIVSAGHDYLFVATSKTWEEAQAYCSVNGYNLVTINDSAEEAFLATHEAARSLNDWWIGYNDKGLEGSWIWANGASTYTNWDTAQPDNSNNEDCATDRFYGREGWNDWPCDSTHPFICERDSVPTSNRGTFPYSASNTGSATVNTFNPSVYLYAGMVFTMGTCGVPGSSGSGDTFLRLNNPSGQEIAFNDDTYGSCGTLSNLSLVVPSTGTYVIRAGCFSSGSCSGTIAFTY
jgi:hypothetical protein